jgi:predicted RNA-binding Zn-ribbon protein involved in translation (DUF1610 family)
MPGPRCTCCGYSLEGLTPAKASGGLYTCPECGMHTLGRPRPESETRFVLAVFALPIAVWLTTIVAFILSAWATSPEEAGGLDRVVAAAAAVLSACMLPLFPVPDRRRWLIAHWPGLLFGWTLLTVAGSFLILMLGVLMRAAGC